MSDLSVVPQVGPEAEAQPAPLLLAVSVTLTPQGVTAVHVETPEGGEVQRAATLPEMRSLLSDGLALVERRMLATETVSLLRQTMQQDLVEAQRAADTRSLVDRLTGPHGKGN